MAKFIIREKKVMPKREDGLASVYNKQFRWDYDATNRHIQRHWRWLLEHAVATNQAEVLVEPLRGFPRRGQANYTAYDIYADLNAQYQRGQDYLDSMIDRWNRLYKDFPDLTIEFDIAQPNENYVALFQEA